MKRPVFALSLIALTACMETSGAGASALPSGYERAEGPHPSAVLSAIPADLILSDILVTTNAHPRAAGCYYYIGEGKIHPVVTLDAMNAGMMDQPYCIQ